MSADESTRLEDYSFDYPKELVAAVPAPRRDGSRLFVIERKTETFSHRQFSDISDYLKEGDCLVINRSKVLPARILGKKPGGGKAELLLVRPRDDGRWRVLSQNLKRGMGISLPDGSTAKVEDLDEDGHWLLRFSSADLAGLMREHGTAPLPPYIRTRRRTMAALPAGAEEADRERYQTVYAREEGSVAAPTAGLHFTPEILKGLKDKGVRIAEVICHVGRGTFKPVSAADIRNHVMLPEIYEVPELSEKEIIGARREKRRIAAVGTSSVRVLETLAKTGESSGASGLFIHPGHAFKSVDLLITNFHQPASTPILLTAAFAGRERLLAAYKEAVGKEYRLFSYGDSMLIL